MTSRQILDETIKLAGPVDEERRHRAAAQAQQPPQAGPAQKALEAFLMQQTDETLVKLLTLRAAGHRDATTTADISLKYEDQVRRPRSKEHRVAILVTTEGLAKRLTGGLAVAEKQRFDLDQASKLT